MNRNGAEWACRFCGKPGWGEYSFRSMNPDEGERRRSVWLCVACLMDAREENYDHRQVAQRNDEHLKRVRYGAPVAEPARAADGLSELVTAVRDVAARLNDIERCLKQKEPKP